MKTQPPLKRGPKPDVYGARTNVVSVCIGRETLRLLLLRAKARKVSRNREAGDILRAVLHGTREAGKVFNA